MSTKIYDAFILDKSINSLTKLQELSQSLKETIHAEARIKMANDIARRVTHNKDLYAYYGDSVLRRKKYPIKDEHKLEALKYLSEHQNDDPEKIADHIWIMEILNYPQALKELRSFSRTHEVSILYFPCGRKTLAMVFGDSTYFHHFYENSLIRDYHYQNQTDRPDDITAREWHQREKDWDKAIGPDYVPTHTGFKFELLDFDDSDLTFDIMQDEENRDKAFRLAEANYEDRVQNIRDTIECPLFVPGMKPSEWYRTMRTPEYEKWAKRQNRLIRKKMGWPKEEKKDDHD